MLMRGFLLRCPNCGKGRIFRKFFTANDACVECGHDYVRDPGDWTGGAEMTLLLTFPVGIAFLFALMTWADFAPAVEIALVVAFTAVFLPLVYRHVKGFWLGVIRAWDGPDPQPSPIREPEWFTALWDREGR